MPTYPADTSPAPVLCWGTRRMARAYSGDAAQIYNPDTAAFHSIGFDGNVIDAAAIDTVLDGEIGRVTQLFDQLGTGYGLGQTTGEAPRIKDLEINGVRALICQGGSEPIVGVLPGSLCSMNMPDISALNLSAGNITIAVLIWPSSSMYRNQGSTPATAIGTIVSLESASGSVLQLYADGNAGRGCYAVRDNSAFTFEPDNTMVEAGPTVLILSTGPAGTFLFQNGTLRETSDFSAVTAPIVAGYVGKRGTSVAGGASESGDFMFDSLMIIPQQLSRRQCAALSASFYNHAGLTPRRSFRSAPNVICIGDSIPAGHTTLGLYGFMPMLQAALPHVRFGNFCIPGAQTTSVPGMPYYGYMLGAFPDSHLPHLNWSKSCNVLMMMGPGNDYARNPTLLYTAQTGSFHIGATLTGASSGAHAPIIYVQDDGSTGSILFDWTAVSGNFVHGEIVTDGLGGSATANGTQSGGPPPAADVYAARVDMIAQGRAFNPDLKVIMFTLPKRPASYLSRIDDENILIRAGAIANDYTVVDVALLPGFDVLPGPKYADSGGHMNTEGFQDAADAALPVLEAMFAA